MKRIKISQIDMALLGNSLKVCGWVRTVRTQKTTSFIELNDGSTLGGIQIVVDDPQLLEQVSTGASLAATGILVESPSSAVEQKWELKASKIDLFGTSPPEYPLQKKRHSFEFLRSIAHLRPRTNTQGAVLRVRNQLAFATHTFFQTRGYVYVQTPIITASDCEGGGEQFLVTKLDLEHLPRHPDNSVDFTSDFFHRAAYLTVSGQLNGEALALALSDIYTFGPTFRAENSNTSRHLAEFWMIEPEMAFATLEDIMECAEQYLKMVTGAILSNCPQELDFFEQFIEKGICERLQKVVEEPFARLTYTEAISILEASGQSFEFPVKWGSDLHSEHERYLAEVYCKKPLILTNYPSEIKSFYMRSNGDGKTVAAMDILVPKIGEIIGGSQREERYEVLEKKIANRGLKREAYDWYLQLRKYGTVPHSGFGVGFERLVQFVTGMENIRDAIPFPRYPGHVEF